MRIAFMDNFADRRFRPDTTKTGQGPLAALQARISTTE
jgi:hypothetical protein